MHKRRINGKRAGHRGVAQGGVTPYEMVLFVV